MCKNSGWRLGENMRLHKGQADGLSPDSRVKRLEAGSVSRRLDAKRDEHGSAVKKRGVTEWQKKSA